MLKSMSISNFKSLRHTANLNLAPISILAGPNSSGKSSLIQTLLLMKQTLESPSSDDTEDAIILNGSWVALGEYNDVLSFTARDDEGVAISIALQYPPADQGSAGQTETGAYYRSGVRMDRGGLRTSYRRSRIGAGESYSAELTLKFERPHSSNHLDVRGSQFVLRSTQLRVSTDVGLFSDAILEATLSSAALQNLKTNYQVPISLSGRDVALYPVTRLEPAQSGTGDIVACSLTHFLPSLAWTADPDQVILQLLAAANRFSAQEQKSPAVATRFMRARTMMRRKREESNKPAQHENLDKRLQWLLSGENTILPIIRDYLQSHRDEKWEERFEQAKSKPPIAPSPLIFSSLLRDPDLPVLDLDTVAEDFAGFFTGELFYLGPLRQEPQAFYRRLGSSDPRYVGQRGENTAFVLKYQGSKSVRFVEPPSSGSDWDPRSALVTSRPLTHAVKAWMRYLGLATDLEVRDVGKIGLSIQASVHAGKKYSDLTNVGVGVSQALPLIVLGLASPPGSTLLFEQPELHLHPYVQSRLADFFLSLTAMGKQVIAETHSEHLIHRMRLYVARGTLSPEKDLAIYFFSNTSDSSESRVRPIKIGEYGEIDEWPEGFFDETTKQLDAILKATLDRAEAEEEE